MYFVSMQTETTVGSRILIKIDFAPRARLKVIRNWDIISEFINLWISWGYVWKPFVIVVEEIFKSETFFLFSAY